MAKSKKPAAAIPDTITTTQLLYGLATFGGITLSNERLRQLREGYTERRVATGYTRDYEPLLTKHEDWIHMETVGFTRSGTRKLFERYGIHLSGERWREMKRQPRNRWQQRKTGPAAGPLP